MIYLAACLLPMPWAMAASGLGAALADVLTGCAYWAPWTLVIKMLMVPAFTRKGKRMLCRRNMFALLVGFLITLFGYYFAEYFIYGELTAFIVAIPGAIFQAGGSTIVFVLLAAAFDRAGVRRLFV